MQTTPPNEVHSIVASSNGRLVVCFLKEAGCPNCEQTKPVLAAMAQANPDTQFAYVTVKDGSEVTPGFQFRMFPGIFSFENGQLVRAFSGAKTARQLSFMFSRPNDLKVAAWDALEASRFVENELKEYNVGCGYAAPVAANVAAPVAHVTPLAMPPEAPEDECDGCA